MEQQFWNEYHLIYQTYEGYNEQVLILKGWSVTVGLAALIAAYTKPVSRSGRIGVTVAALSAVPFWLTETFWKLFQQAYLARIERLEECARSEFEGCEVMQIASTWVRSFHQDRWSDWFGVAFDPHVLLPHAALFGLGLVLALKWPPSP